MKNVLLTLALLSGVLSLQAQQIPAYTAGRLMQRVSNPDTVYIVSFWATWCGPCIKELPSFDTLQRAYEGQPVKVLLVSFDFKDSYPAKLAAYLKKKNIQPEVVWFSETDANEFIPKIEKSWSGGLPATLVVNARKSARVFMERPVQVADVEKALAEARR